MKKLADITLEDWVAYERHIKVENELHKSRLEELEKQENLRYTAEITRWNNRSWLSRWRTEEPHQHWIFPEELDTFIVEPTLEGFLSFLAKDIK